jgi:hypothetical protein
VPKSVLVALITRLKVFKAKNTILKTFDLVIKVTSTDFGTRSKVLKAKNTIIKTFDLVKNLYKSFDLVPKTVEIIETFDLVKNDF